MLTEEMTHGAWAGSRRPAGLKTNRVTLSRRSFAPVKSPVTEPSRIETETVILPDVIALGVWEEAVAWLDEPLPRRWIRQLVARANTVYAHNERFRRRLRAEGDAGRDHLWMFMRHWLAAIILRHRPGLHVRLPVGYNSGQALPDSRQV